MNMSLHYAGKPLGCGCVDTMSFVCHAISQDHVIKGSCGFKVRKPLG